MLAGGRTCIPSPFSCSRFNPLPLCSQIPSQAQALYLPLPPALTLPLALTLALTQTLALPLALTQTLALALTLPPALTHTLALALTLPLALTQTLALLRVLARTLSRSTASCQFAVSQAGTTWTEGTPRPILS